MKKKFYSNSFFFLVLLIALSTLLFWTLVEGLPHPHPDDLINLSWSNETIMTDSPKEEPSSNGKGVMFIVSLIITLLIVLCALSLIIFCCYTYISPFIQPVILGDADSSSSVGGESTAATSFTTSFGGKKKTKSGFLKRSKSRSPKGGSKIAENDSKSCAGGAGSKSGAVLGSGPSSSASA